MLVTAHGAKRFFNREKDTREFFATINKYAVDVIETDVRKKGDFMYISHLPRFFPKKHCLTFKYVLEYAKEYGYFVNCDVKQGGLVKEITELAAELNMEDKILFTGEVQENEIKETSADIWLNKKFFGLELFPENVAKIKERIENLAAPNVKGVNLKYTLLTEEFIEKCAEEGIDMSIFVVDDEEAQKTLLKYSNVKNITSNIPFVTLNLLGRKVDSDKK